MWLEVDARYVPQWERDEKGNPLEIISQSPLEKGQRKILFCKKTPVTRRTKAVAVVTPLDEDTAEIKFNGEEESPVSVGIAGEFTYQILPEDTRDGMVVTKQDMVVWGANDTIRGILWVNEDGQRLHPRYMQYGRSFYEGDSDPEALALFQTLQRLKEGKRAIAEGRMVYENHISICGMVVGIEYEFPAENIPSES